jgi:hypothetical protein
LRPDERRGNSGRCAGDPRHRVMLGHPEALVSKPLDMAGEVGGVAERLTGVAAFSNRRQVQDRERRHAKDVGSARSDSMQECQLWVCSGPKDSTERGRGPLT